MHMFFSPFFPLFPVLLWLHVKHCFAVTLTHLKKIMNFSLFLSSCSSCLPAFYHFLRRHDGEAADGPAAQEQEREDDVLVAEGDHLQVPAAGPVQVEKVVVYAPHQPVHVLELLQADFQAVKTFFFALD